MHIVQLWVNLPARLKFTPPRYQAITGDNLTLLTTPDGASLLRIIAGNIGPFEGPGSTHTPITYAHVTVSPGAQAKIPWNPAFNAFAYVLSGGGYAGTEDYPIADHQLVVFGAGDHLILRAAGVPADGASALDVLVLGGIPIREPIAHYGPFVMNTRDEIIRTLDDFRRGRLGVIPADQLVPRRFS
jgi:quercetin 2,3-dioxygenase